MVWVPHGTSDIAVQCSTTFVRQCTLHAAADWIDVQSHILTCYLPRTVEGAIFARKEETTPQLV